MQAIDGAENKKNAVEGELKIKKASDKQDKSLEKDRDALRKMHEQMRKDKQKTLSNGGGEGYIAGNESSYKNLRSKKQGQ